MVQSLEVPHMSQLDWAVFCCSENYLEVYD